MQVEYAPIKSALTDVSSPLRGKAAGMKNPGIAMRGLNIIGLGAFIIVQSSSAWASEALDGATLPLWVGAPFAGLLLSIALGPLLVTRLWHLHYDKAAALWAILALVMLVATQGLTQAAAAFVHAFLVDYLPFILMLFALYTVAGGVVVRGLPKATPLGNCLMLAAGTLAASFIGTTGASMILIRPLLRANAGRAQRAHVVIFFIFLVSNIGGALSPLGDPPLFFGFLRGIDFFWPLRNLWLQTSFMTLAVLLVFFCLDLYFFRREKASGAQPAKPFVSGKGFEIAGKANIVLILAAVGAIVASGVWRPGADLDVFGTHVALSSLARDAIMLAIGCVSLAVTSKDLHIENGFRWEPFQEVAKLFAAIFICIIPVMAMLAAHAHGPFESIIGLLSRADGTPNDKVYFWATGLLACLLDNAPTYLVFFGVAGGDPAQLMGPLSKMLAAISLGAVYMGALTPIGNAPNFMIYTMALRARVPMPGFFGYMIWSTAVLVPIMIVCTFVFF
jgi:Na+/H+ antiporter NhaD/arsenite permease-like protein